ncbi:MAG: hypothetical protein QOI78_2169 [Actinomycetota bacterium]|nr:hypothetical protein [Actinomycetota bacterium]
MNDDQAPSRRGDPRGPRAHRRRDDRPVHDPAAGDHIPAQVDSAVSTYLVLLSVVGALGVAAWLGTAWAVKAGKRWTRAATAALFALGTGIGLTGLLVTDTSGDTGLPPAPAWTGLAPCLAALVAVGVLGRRPRPA